jgi:hypothetical protein
VVNPLPDKLDLPDQFVVEPGAEVVQRQVSERFEGRYPGRARDGVDLTHLEIQCCDTGRVPQIDFVIAVSRRLDDLVPSQSGHHSLTQDA